MNENSWDAVIVGGGAAGLSAALMLGRSRRRTLVIDAGRPRNRFASHMHGVLGQEGVPPADLIERGRVEAASYGMEFAEGTVERVEPGDVDLRIATTDGAVASARALVLATGLSDELPEVPGLAERWGATVLHCPYCHGWEVRDRRLGVLLTSPLGLHQAELVRQWSDRVTVFTARIGELAPETERRLRARGVELEPEPILDILGEGTGIESVRLSSGRQIAIDAIFTAGAPRPHDELVAPLGLARAETPFGSFLAVDPTGKTSDDRIWAIGNVVNPGANVPVSIGAGSFAGGAVNAALVARDFDAAVRDPGSSADILPADFWEERYSGSERIWSGNVNRVLADVADALVPGSALDLGCGEGADVIWLAEHGWDATGIDISSTAIGRAKAAAESAGQDRARFLVGDLTTMPPGAYDLVSASFLHSPVALPREEILRQAAARVAPNGHLLVTSHAGAPHWAEGHDGHEERFPEPQEELDRLALDPEEWEAILVETRSRDTVSPDGEPTTLDDAIILLRRR